MIISLFKLQEVMTVLVQVTGNHDCCLVKSKGSSNTTPGSTCDPRREQTIPPIVNIIATWFDLFCLYKLISINLCPR